MVSVCLPSDALLQHLPSYLGFSYLGHGVSLHGCSSKAQPLFLTLDKGYLLTAALPDLIANTLFQQHKRKLYTWTSPDSQHRNQLIIFFAAKDGEALYSQQKQDQELTVAQISREPRVSCLNPRKTSSDLLQHVSRPDSPTMAREQ